MILTVTLNPALDLTYAVPALVPGATHRVDGVASRPGGKGVNVARVLHALGEPVVAAGLAGGGTGARLRAELAAAGIEEAFTPIAGETRRTVVVAAPTGATGFWEPGPEVTAGEWAAFLAGYPALVRRAALVVLAGSLPRGVPADAYARLVEVARAAGAATILDADGPALRHGLAAGPDLVKPNADELAGLGAPPQRLGARDVVSSHGEAGLVASTSAGSWTAALARPLPGNATGAGDACVAALARAWCGRSRGRSASSTRWRCPRPR
ncbi:1-phosphofructokinase family hexose kinase [Phytohabitans houttuyneae]|uniref:Sugar kinase n=1 Tax=Phytohabitans houttuyneae TaxID=1076126 RepID=A0A6V8KCP9_9ACTN|nr:hexose kinase [Phytohabitans houttuyneae]GFJ82993.1 sugar kinase [Phytohabitans houttuyneae]